MLDIIAQTITADPVLDLLLQYGVAGLAIYLMYRLKGRNDHESDEKLRETLTQFAHTLDVNTQVLQHMDKHMVQMDSRLGQMDKRMAHIERQQDDEGKTLAVFESLAKQTSDIQQNQLALMNRQLAILDQQHRMLERIDNKLDIKISGASPPPTPSKPKAKSNG